MTGAESNHVTVTACRRSKVAPAEPAECPHACRAAGLARRDSPRCGGEFTCEVAWKSAVLLVINLALLRGFSSHSPDGPVAAGVAFGILATAIEVAGIRFILRPMHLHFVASGSCSYYALYALVTLLYYAVVVLLYVYALYRMFPSAF